MADRRKPGQSLLDYLWTTFKDYAVSGRMEDSPRDYIPTLALVDKLIKNSSIELFKVVESLPEEGEENKIYLVQSGTDYAAYAFVGSLPILIGNVGGDLELQNKVDELEGKITDLEDNTITGLNAITTTNTDGDTIIKLKLDNTGNVVLSQSNTGLKALVPVDGINSTDTVLTLTDKKLSTTLNFTYDEASKKIKLTGVGDVIIGEIDTTDFIVGSMLSGVSFDETTHILTLTFNADSGQEPIEVDLSKLVDVYDGSNIRLKNIAIPSTNAVEPAANDTLDSAVSNLIKKDRELKAAIDKITTNPENLIGTAEVKVTSFDTLELSANLITIDDLWLTTGPKAGYIVKLSNTDNASLTTEAIVVSVFRYNNYAKNTYKCLLQIATSENTDDAPIFRYVWAKIAIARGYGYNEIAEWEVLDANLRLYNVGLTTDYKFTEGAGYSATYPNGATFSQLKALGLDTGYIVPVTVVNLSSTTPERHGFYQDGVITISDINGVVTYLIEYYEGSSPQAELKKLKEVNFDSLLKGLVFETGPNPGYTFIVGEEIDSNRILYEAIHSLDLSDAIIPVKIHDFTSKESPLGFYDLKNDCIYTSDVYGFRKYSVLIDTVELTQVREWTDSSVHLVTDDPEMNFQLLGLRVSQPDSWNLTYPVIVDDTLLETTEPGFYYSSFYGGRLVITFGVNGIHKYDVTIHTEDDLGEFILNRVLPDPIFKPIVDTARGDRLYLEDISNPAQLSNLNLVSGATYDILFGAGIIGKLFVSGGTGVRDGLTLTAFGKLEVLTEFSLTGEISTILMKGYDFSICVANYNMVSDKYEWRAYNNSYTREETDKLIDNVIPTIYIGDTLTDELKLHNLNIIGETLGLRDIIVLDAEDGYKIYGYYLISNNIVILNIVEGMFAAIPIDNTGVPNMEETEISPLSELFGIKQPKSITFQDLVAQTDLTLEDGTYTVSYKDDWRISDNIATLLVLTIKQPRDRDEKLYILTGLVAGGLTLKDMDAGELPEDYSLKFSKAAHNTYKAATAGGLPLLWMLTGSLINLETYPTATSHAKSSTLDETISLNVGVEKNYDFVSEQSVNKVGISLKAYDPENADDSELTDDNHSLITARAVKMIKDDLETALDTKADKTDLDKVEDTVNLLATIGSVEYVDLGLPSGLLWATCNLGASTPEELGDQIYRFTSSDDFDADGNVKLEKDPAHLAYGGDWRMPSEDDYAELYSHCSVYAVTENSKSFMQAFSKVNGNTLKIPITDLINSSGSYYYNMNTILRDKINNATLCKYVRLDFVPPRTYSLAFPPYTGYGAFIRPVTTNPINPNKLTTISKIDSYTVNGKKIINNPTLSKSDIGLASVDNTSDLSKPISIATLTALDKKADKTKTVLLSDIKDASTLPLLDTGKYDVTDNNLVIATLDVYRGTRDDLEIAKYVIKGPVIIGYALDPELFNDRSLYYDVDAYGIYSAFGYVEDSLLKRALWTECTVSLNIDPDSIPETTLYNKGVIKQLGTLPAVVEHSSTESANDVAYLDVGYGKEEDNEDSEDMTRLRLYLNVCDPEDIENAELYLDENNHSLVTARTLNTVKENIYSELNNKVNTFAFEALASGVTEDLETKANISDLSNVLAEDVVDGDTLTGVDIVTRETLKKDLFIDLWNTACGTNGTYNEETGFFELNGLTDITYAEAVKIYEYGSPTLLDMSGLYLNAEIRTNLPPMSSKKSASSITNSLARMVENSTIEVLNIGRVMPGDIAYLDIPFKTSKSKLKKIIGLIGMYYCTNIGSNASWPFFESTVEEFLISDINTNIYLGNLANISLSSLTYLVTWRRTASPLDVVVTVHPDVYAKLTDTSNTEWNQLMQDAVAKQITFASAS